MTIANASKQVVILLSGDCHVSIGIVRMSEGTKTETHSVTIN
jgi:arginase family enzyme